MRKTGVLLAVVGLLFLAVGGGAAWAQGEEGAVIGNPSAIPDYAYFKGEVYVDGDEVVSCRQFAEDFEGFYSERGNQGQAKRALEQCERAGMPGLRIPAEVRAEMRGDALPQTGGASPLPLVAGLLLAGAGLGALLRGAGAREGR